MGSMDIGGGFSFGGFGGGTSGTASAASGGSGPAASRSPGGRPSSALRTAPPTR